MSWRERHAANARYQQYRGLPLAPRLSAAAAPAQRWLPARLRRTVTDLLADRWPRRLPAPNLAVRLADLSFRTADERGLPRDVPGLVVAPVALPTDDRRITLYLPSSGARVGPVLEGEAVAAALRFHPHRRLLVVPLPVREQRGEPWPSLFGADLDQFTTLVRQAGLDLRRAVDVARDQGWQVDGLAGFSLGACFAADLAGVYADAFAGAELHLWAGGGNLGQLVTTTEHPLARCLARPPDLPWWLYRRRLAALDPVNHLGHARVRQVHLVAGRRDDLVPLANTLALREACRRAGLPVELTLQEGGHLGSLGPAEALGSLLPWADGG